VQNAEIEALNRAVDGTARVLEMSAHRLQQAMIMLLACDAGGSKLYSGSESQQQLHGKARDMRRLVRLLDDSAHRLRDLLHDLEAGKPVEKICEDIYAYGSFLCDQLLSETDDACRLIKTMRIVTKETEREPT